MARNDADAMIEHLKSKGIDFTVGKAWQPAKKTSSREKLVADELYVGRPDTTIETGIFVTMQARTRGMNAREHWTARNKRTQAEHMELELLLSAHTMKREMLAWGCVVTMCRIGRRVDDDNLRGYLKGIRDYIAQWLLGGSMGEMDSSPLIDWRYEQVTIGRASGVTVSIQRATA